MKAAKVESPVPSDAAAALRAAGYRVTPQRLVIHRTLVALHRHVGAEELLDAVGDQLPNVSLPTVYSALDALEDSGLVRRVSAGQGRALYDARPADHHHLVCRRCGRTVEVAERSVERWAARIAAAEGFVDVAHTVEVVGTCPDCARQLLEP